MIAFTERYRARREQEFVCDALQEPSISSKGKYQIKCEEFLKNMYGCTRAIITPNGFTAIYLALLLIGIERDDEVIISSYSCPAALNCVLLQQAQPVLCGIDDSGCMPLSVISKAVSSKTKAIIVNHYGGFVKNITNIAEFCRIHGIYLIEDCATAFGSKYNKQLAGSFGSFGVLSFNDKKDLCAGEGGALLINDSSKLFFANSHRYSNGIVRDAGNGKPRWVGAGFSNKISDIVCAVMYAQFLDSQLLIEKKKKLFQEYYLNLFDCENIQFYKLPSIDKGEEPNGNTFFIINHSEKIRNELRDYLLRNGIISLSHYGSLRHVQKNVPSIQYVGNEDGESFDSKILRLPIHSGLKTHDVVDICLKIKKFIREVADG